MTFGGENEVAAGTQIRTEKSRLALRPRPPDGHHALT